jgi:alpha-amylase/alpha-mannosidase (GH57 family)
MEKYICIHGHFYQPPRENPWLDEVELQNSASPYHDWNERITEECYAPLTASRILDREGRIVDIANLYAKISFNFGPTLLSWMERHRPDIYGAIVEADAVSREQYSGHGSAIAQVYNHMIMPLATKRDKITQVRWGLEDFRRRFNREPEGMWLPETAVDLESLEVLAAEGVRFSILAPRQARRFKVFSESPWTEVNDTAIDPTRPYLCRLPSGGEIALFFYDGSISRDVAFGGLLSNGGDFANRLMGAFPGERGEGALVNMATDGETYGHHFQGGDMALAYGLHQIENTEGISLTNYGEFLERHPPDHEVEIFENSSWSCVHGVERWRKDCGCSSGPHPGWSQSWREPLREAMEWLGGKLADIFADEGSAFFGDPWAARDAYVAVLLDRKREHVDDFLRTHGSRELSPPEKARALKLLEMQKNALLIFTSCGWFFDDVAGIETIQILRYAAQAIQYLREIEGTSLEEEFVAILARAPGNARGNGAEVYQTSVKPAMTDYLRVGGHYGISSLFEDYSKETRINCYTFGRENFERREAGRYQLVTGRVQVRSDLTWDEQVLSFAALHFGDQNMNCGVRRYVGSASFEKMRLDIGETFEKGDVTKVIRLIDHYFRPHSYTVWHLFRDEQRKILDEVLRRTYEDIESSYRQVYETNYPLMNFLTSMEIPLPRPLFVAVEYVSSRDLRTIVEGEPLDEERLSMIISDVKRWALNVDRKMARFYSSARVTSLLERFHGEPASLHLLRSAVKIMELLKDIGVEFDLWKAQNVFFAIARDILPVMMKREARGDGEAEKWVSTFRSLEPHLGVRIP